MMNKEETLLQKRLIELANLAFKRDIVTFSDFLNLNELNILHTIPKNMFPVRYEIFGGYDFSERQMVAFLPDALYYDYQYPIQILKIEPLNKRFSEQLTHRDYLGAVMNLGIERSKMGDILIEDGQAILFVKDGLADYIIENLTRVKHTVVIAAVCSVLDFDYTPKFEEIKGNVPSIRLDTVLSTAFPVSRSHITGYIESGKVFVNGKLITSNGYHLKENDIISVRGMGRVSYQGTISQTKKGRYMIMVRKYI